MHHFVLDTAWTGSKLCVSNETIIDVIFFVHKNLPTYVLKESDEDVQRATTVCNHYSHRYRSYWNLETFKMIQFCRLLLVRSSNSSINICFLEHEFWQLLGNQEKYLNLSRWHGMFRQANVLSSWTTWQHIIHAMLTWKIIISFYESVYTKQSKEAFISIHDFSTAMSDTIWIHWPFRQ